MSSTETLTSLAMLKVQIDQGLDYLDYLRPFILQVLVDHKPDPVTDKVVHESILSQFGLEIPTRTIQIVLKRLSRKHSLKLENGVYRITGALPDPGITRQKSEAQRHISAVITGLVEYAKGTPEQAMTDEDAVLAICGFLSEFNVECLQAYLLGTTIPIVDRRDQKLIVLVSRYVLDLQQHDPERFDSFLVVLQGHMIANSLLCPDLETAPRSYKDVTFYLDTPLLVQVLGLDGELKQNAINELIDLIRNLEGTVATFEHCRQELEKVIVGAAEHVSAPDGRGEIVMEARRNGTTKSDLILLAENIDELLEASKVEVHETPKYIADFQIDQDAFSKILDDEVRYYNPRAPEYDINSVRSIYVLRKNKMPSSIEKSRAVLITSNRSFATAAFKYGQRHEETREVSSVISDFSLANMAWLKAPVGAPAVPVTELLAYSYAALHPSRKLLEKYMNEINKLQKQGKISSRDHQLLRSSMLAQDELMQLTLGDDKALSEATITETLKRVSSDIKREEMIHTEKEKKSHRITRARLSDTLKRKLILEKRIYWKCEKRSRIAAKAIIWLYSFVLIVGFAVGLVLLMKRSAIAWPLLLCSGILSAASLTNLFVGTTVVHLYGMLQSYFLRRLLERETLATGIEFDGANNEE